MQDFMPHVIRRKPKQHESQRKSINTQSFNFEDIGCSVPSLQTTTVTLASLRKSNNSNLT